MKLNSEEKDMLAGGRGVVVRDAMAFQISVGEFWGAERFVPISNAHMMGDIEVMGDAGLDWLEHSCEHKATCSVPTTTNPRCFDFNHVQDLGQDPGEAEKEKRIIRILRDMNVVTTDTCINYQTVYQPHIGEHVAWGDTGTVIYANSVFGARTNYEGGPAVLAAAMTGRTPAYGFHLDEHRGGTVSVRIEAKLDDLADWGAVGKIVGEAHQNYFSVPVLHGSGRSPVADELKQLGCSLASYGSMAMFHIVGATPEAPTLEDAFRGKPPRAEMVIRNADLERVYAGYEVGDGHAPLVVFSGPQLSILEMKDIARRFAGRHVAKGTDVYITTAPSVAAEARRLGYLQVLEAAGVHLLEGVCFYILQNLSAMRVAHGWNNLVSNSAKLVNIIGAHKFNTILRRTQECVDIACSGRVDGGAA